MSNKKKVTMIDPPSGWRYGFPKVIPDDRRKDVTAWLVENGYPQYEIDNWGNDMVCRYWEADEEDLI